MADRSTLVRPPPLNPSKSAIENVLELTELSAIGPVGSAIPQLFNSLSYNGSLTYIPSGHLHQHSSSLASARSARNLRRRGDSTMSIRRPANSATSFPRPFHALLFRACRRCHHSRHVLCRTRTWRSLICYKNSASSSKRKMYLHHHHEFRERR